MYTVLVTGCGGDIGQSICKVLKAYDQVGTIIGCDIHGNHPGKFLCDEFVIVPRCDNSSYFPELQKLVESFKIDFIISASEPELRMFLVKEIDKKLFGKPVIMANQKALEIGFNKLKTADFLKSQGFPFPKSAVISEVTTPSFPLILKSKDGSGSKSIFVLKDMEDFVFYKRKFPDFIAQAYVGSETTEYTCGLFRSSRGEIRDVIFNRTLVGGFSNFGIVEHNNPISNLLTRLAVALDLSGSINVQLRLTPHEPVVFEINPRFSSTVLFRDLLGFKDLIWSIEDALELTLSPYETVKAGRKFYKGYQEYYE